MFTNVLQTIVFHYIVKHKNSSGSYNQTVLLILKTFLHILILNHYKQKSYSMYVFVLYAKFTETKKSIIYLYIQANKCLNLVCFQGRHKTSVLSILFYSIVIVSSYLYVPYITLKAKSDLSYNRPYNCILVGGKYQNITRSS